MELPLFRSQITDYFNQTELMDYYTLQQALASMVEEGYLKESIENNNTLYAITNEGQNTLELLEKHIPPPARAMISGYVREKRRDLKRHYENTATFFPNAEYNEFIVKCGVYEDERALMELSIAVDTREQARLIQTNWKANAKILYGKILVDLTTSPLD
jgi:DNA-binding PadR family transcriptional regulator